jgi:hypothetical protein
MELRCPCSKVDVRGAGAVAARLAPVMVRRVGAVTRLTQAPGQVDGGSLRVGWRRPRA